jgi:hypothetical protein
MRETQGYVDFAAGLTEPTLQVGNAKRQRDYGIETKHPRRYAEVRPVSDTTRVENSLMTDTTQNRKSSDWASPIVGIITFGTLMGFRDAFDSIWIRAFVAACAFVVLGLTLGRHAFHRASDK